MQVKIEDFKRMLREDSNYGEKKKAKSAKVGKSANRKYSFKNMSVKDLLGIGEDMPFCL